MLWTLLYGRIEPKLSQYTCRNAYLSIFVDNKQYRTTLHPVYTSVCARREVWLPSHASPCRTYNQKPPSSPSIRFPCSYKDILPSNLWQRHNIICVIPLVDAVISNKALRDSQRSNHALRGSTSFQRVSSRTAQHYVLGEKAALSRITYNQITPPHLQG